MSYQQEIAQWRQQRRQDEAQSRVNELRQEHTQAIRQRDHAIASNDMEEAAYQDNVCMDLEREFRTLVPQQPQVDPRMAEFVRQRTPFVERHGQAAYQAMDMAHRYATAPHDPNANPATVAAGRSGMGLKAGTQA